MLTQYKELARNAFLNTSFSPEKRGGDVIACYGEELKEDLAALEEKGSAGEYARKYKERFERWLSAHGRCFSVMITGGGNFNVRKHEKSNSAERKAYDDFRAWREKYFKAVNRVRTKSPEEELDISLKELDDLIVLNEKTKLVNKEIAKLNKGKITLDELIAYIREELGDNVADSFHIYRRAYSDKYSTISTQGPAIKRKKDKIEAMKIRIERKASFDVIEFNGGRIDIIDDRVQIIFDDKPGEEARAAMKGRGFRWSPKSGAWVRKHTLAALNTAISIVKSL